MTDDPNSPSIKGWVPSAYRPMASGDGLIMRLKPFMARYDAEALRQIAEIAETFGLGAVSLTNRANMQVRGLDQDGYNRALERLQDIGIVDEDAQRDTANAIIINPFWQGGDTTETVAGILHDALAGLPPLPGKFGFVADCGKRPILRGASGDIRIECASDGSLILLADGAEAGLAVSCETLAGEIYALIEWYLKSGGVSDGRGRMRDLVRKQGLPDRFTTAAQPDADQGVPPLGKIHHSDFSAVYFAAMLGEITAQSLRKLADNADAIRLTPWRSFVVENPGPALDETPFIRDSEDPRRRVSACIGSAGCPSAQQPTRQLAEEIAGHLPAGVHVHVSGCTKGCFYQQECELTFTACQSGFDVIEGGLADGVPLLHGLQASEVLSLIEDRYAASL